MPNRRVWPEVAASARVCCCRGDITCIYRMAGRHLYHVGSKMASGRVEEFCKRLCASLVGTRLSRTENHISDCIMARESVTNATTSNLTVAIFLCPPTFSVSVLTVVEGYSYLVSCPNTTHKSGGLGTLYQYLGCAESAVT